MGNTDTNETSWTWKEVQAQGMESRGAHYSMQAVPLLIPFIIAALLFLWGRLFLGTVVAGIGLVLVFLKVAIPHLHHLILRLLAALGKWLGKVVSYTMLTIVYVLLFTPVALFARLFRRDPLSLKWLPSPRTYWSGIPNVDPTRLFANQFLAESRQAEGYAGQGFLRIGRAAYHTALSVLLLNLVLGFLYKNAKEIIAPDHQEDRYQSSVYAGSSWGSDYFEEFVESQEVRYEPFLGWVRKDYAGRYINIEGGVRKTYQSATNSHGALRLYAFGGSTMWGTGARDEYTIPSYLAKEAEQDGIPIKVSNFGEMGYVHWQGVIRLVELCAEGKVPDLVVFYEGANDVGAKLQEPNMNRIHQNFADWRKRNERGSVAHILADWFKMHSIVHILGRELGQVLEEAETKYSKLVVQEMAEEVVTTIAENTSVVRKLAEAYGFRVWVFWQPVIYTKDKLTEEESRGREPPWSNRLGEVYHAATKGIGVRDWAIDLSDAFNDHHGTMYIDWAHTGEIGNQIIARKIYQHLRPTVEAFALSKELKDDEHSRR